MNAKRLLMINILVLVIIVGGGFLGYYFLNQSQTYLSTDNAKIDGQQIVIAAPATGQLVDWTGETGKSYAAGDTLGTIQMAGATAVAGKPAAAVTIPVKIPTAATIVQQNAVKDSIVMAGMPLAYAYDFKNLWVTANINETDINDVKLGQQVDIYVDAYPGTTLGGRVERIGLATASTFSLLPSSNNTANFTKVTQVIPVTIKLDGQNQNLVPGMSVSVRIHR